jgi:hypothetical protein
MMMHDARKLRNSRAASEYDGNRDGGAGESEVSVK